MAPNPSPSNAAHLLRRAAWGGTPAEIQQIIDAGIESAVDGLLDPTAAPTVGEPLRRPGYDAFDIGALQAWFARLAATSPTPAIERLTWFWSGHFATGIEKIELPDLLHRQWVTCRRLGLGRFDELLKAISRDPAMILWLDLERSVVGNPNENFARELMELFSMGASNGYNQADVVNAARAFTGYGVQGFMGRPQQFLRVRSAHDYGTKTFLGERGRFDGDGIINRIVERRECHEFIARRFWHRYAGTEPTPGIVGEIADAFGRRLRIDDLLRTMLTMDAFYTDEVKGGLVSQPFEALVRTIRGFELPVYDAERLPFEDDDAEEDGVLPGWMLADLCVQLRQEPGNPPNVAGWPHNMAWLDSNRAAGRLLAGIELGGWIAEEAAVGESLAAMASTPGRLTSELFDRFGVVDVSAETADAIGAATRGLDPEAAVAAAFAVAFTSPEVTLA